MSHDHRFLPSSFHCTKYNIWYKMITAFNGHKQVVKMSRILAGGINPTAKTTAYGLSQVAGRCYSATGCLCPATA